MQWSKVVLAMVAAVLFAGAARADVFNMAPGLTSLSMVTVGDPGNAPDIYTGMNGTVMGSVGYTYQIGTYDVTAGQYCEFLNAVAKTDPYGLYNTSMAGWPGTRACGIARTGSAGNYTYNTTSSGYAVNNGNFPVNLVSWGDAARFCNWLTNGQPATGAENLTTTENGSYYVNGATGWGSLLRVTRSANATYVIPTENEWYKAAYYKGGGTNAGYWAYPTQSDTVPSNVLSSTGTNNANFNNYYDGSSHYSDPTNCLTVVGAFAGSPSPYGTFDMGGDVAQWNETKMSSGFFGVRGGTYDGSGSAPQTGWNAFFGTWENEDWGFRVAEVPEPCSASLLLLVAPALLRSRRRK